MLASSPSRTWPGLAGLHVRHRAGFAYVGAGLPDSQPIGSAEHVLDRASDLYLTNPEPFKVPPKDELRGRRGVAASRGRRPTAS